MDLDSKAQQVAAVLAQAEEQLVLAESCTAGVVAATLAQVPGASRWLAGSMVVYQEATKSAWLGVDRETLEQVTAVSAPVAHQMVSGALQQTPHATLAAAVTGHLGPNAPAELDGVVFIATCRRGSSPAIHAAQLTKTKRLGRQREAAVLTLERVMDAIARDAH
ncbi:MAG: nicotinamide-nucleotide amidohydrolase family protein [Pseudomonadota bacterium]